MNSIVHVTPLLISSSVAAHAPSSSSSLAQVLANRRWFTRTAPPDGGGCVGARACMPHATCHVRSYWTFGTSPRFCVEEAVCNRIAHFSVPRCRGFLCYLTLEESLPHASADRLSLRLCALVPAIQYWRIEIVENHQ